MKRKAGIALLFLVAVTPVNAYTRTVKYGVILALSQTWPCE
jgi:hypothetical protein